MRSTVSFSDPFPHVEATDVLPRELFQKMLENLPKWRGPVKRQEELDNISDFWAGVVLPDFESLLGVESSKKVRLVRDPPGYSLGPHTDDPLKVFAFVLYLKGVEGTSLYRPKVEGFTSDGRVHLEAKDFHLVKTTPFIPNSMVGFKRSDVSFHGVEKINEERWTLLYNGFKC